MGLFSNNKKLCPVCGSATPRLLSTKVEGMPLCSACADKLDIRSDVMSNLTLDQLSEYMAFYEGNAPLKAQFHADYERNTGFFKSGTFRCDYGHRTFKLNTADAGIIYTPEHFVRLEIKQDDTPYLVLTKEGMHIFNTGVREAITALQSEIDQFNSMNRVKETMVSADLAMRRQEEMRKAQQAGQVWDEVKYGVEERERERQMTTQMATSFRPQVPFEKWNVTITIDHPWGSGVVDSDNQVWFTSDYPSVNEALSYYQEMVNTMKELAMAFRQVCCPECQIVDETDAPTQTATAAQTGGVSQADEIKKFKELLEAGIITEEEFQAKKKQLLGL